MAGISLLLPKEEMVKNAKHYVKKEGLNVKEIRHIVSENAISEARKAVAEGASVVIARGYQALVIKNYTNIPVIEITLTGQEIGMMVKKAKSMLGIPRPVIGLVGFQNMYSNVDYFDELFDVEMRQYLINFADDLPQTVERAVQDDLDILIGGDVAIMAAQRAGLPYLFVESTFDSIREAIKSAESAIYAAQVEQRYVAQIETFLTHCIDLLTVSPHPSYHHIVQDCLHYIELHYTEEINIIKAAKEIHVNADYLSRVLKKECGCPFLQLLTKYRLEKACSLLSDANLSIGEVSSLTGFKDFRYFGQIFKNEYKMTPTEYRKTAGRNGAHYESHVKKPL